MSTGAVYVFLPDAGGGAPWTFSERINSPNQAVHGQGYGRGVGFDDQSLVITQMDFKLLIGAVFFHERGACPCPGDVDGDGAVGFTDVLGTLTAWGPCPAPPDPCPADLDDDEMVGFADLLVVLGAWGPCEGG